MPLLGLTQSSSLRAFLAELRARRRGIVLFVGGVAVLAVATALLLPSWYSSRSTLLPSPEGTQTFGALQSLIENSALSHLGLVSTSTPSDIYAEILKSRTLHESLVRRFDLERVYGKKGMDRTIKELNHHIRISVSSSGVVAVEIEDRDPHRAADMANFLISELDRFNQETYNTQGKRTRQFLEHRLSDVEQRMREAEALMAAYEQQHKIMAGSDAAAVEGVAKMIAEKLNLEVRRSYMTSYERPGSSALEEIDAQIAGMDRELAKLPGLKQEGQRLALDAEIQRRLFTLITTQSEEARIQELRDTPTITVLDAAEPPEVRSRPKRAVLVVVSTGFAALLAAGWVAARVNLPLEA